MAIKTKTLSFLSIIFSFIALLNVIGCCNSNNTSSQNSSNKTEIEFWNTMTGHEAAVMPKVLKEFHKKFPDILVKEVKYDFYEAKDKFIKLASEGKAPDLLRADRFWIADLVNRGIISELNESDISEELADMVPAAREFITLNNKVWGMPISVDCLAFFFNKAHFREKSLHIPQNIDEFTKACEKLTDPTRNRYGFFIYPNGWYFEPFFFAFGGQYFDKDGKLFIKSDSGRKAFEYLVHLKTKLKAVPPMELNTKLYRTMINSFASGQTSMIFSGPWAIRDVIAGSAFKNNNSDLGIDQIPAGPRGTFSPIGCQSIVISKDSKHKDAALKFIKFMFEYETQKTLTAANYGMPARRKVFADPDLKRDPYLQTFIRQLQMSCKAYTHPQQGDIYGPLGEKIAKVLNGDLSIDYALSDIETEWISQHK